MNRTNITPKTLFEEVQKTVIGQEQYVKTLCTAAWLHYLRYDHFINTGEMIEHPKQNILCLGPSGSGKTLAIQTLGKILQLPVLIEDASALRGAGWKGTNVSSMIARAIDSSKDDIDAAYSIICLDEIDKVFKSRLSESSFLPLDNLLTFLCGGVITHTESNRSLSLDTSNMLIICLGAFDGIEEIIKNRLSDGNRIGFSTKEDQNMAEKNIMQSLTEQDLHEYGIPAEFLGRISLITQTNEFTNSDYRKILTESDASPIKQFDRLLYKSIGTHVSISDAAADYISKKAQNSKSGARLLARTVTEVMQPALYELCDDCNISMSQIDYCDGKLLVKYTYDGRHPEKTRNNDMDQLCDIEQNILDAVPFFCLQRRGDIWIYAEKIKKSFAKAKMFPPEYISAAVCLLAAAICRQLLDEEIKEPTMLLVYKKIEQMDHDKTVECHGLLSEMYTEFLEKAKNYVTDFDRVKKIAKTMIKDYCNFYLNTIKIGS